MQDLTLVVMAAGMGSRFGGPKQITPIDKEDNFIIDYSVYDAILAGFTKVVFVIKEEFLDIFKNTIGKRIEKKIKVEYAFQKNDDIPFKFNRLDERTKPWGTVQAVLCAKPYVNGSFVIINADDFYGRNAYKEAAEFLSENNENYTYASIAYEYKKSTIGDAEVKRGILNLDKNIIKSIVECSIRKENSKIIAKPLNGSEEFEIKDNSLVSMNMFAFKNDLFELLEKYFEAFFEQNEESLLKSEALLPECLKENIDNGKIKIYCKNSNSKWLGMTYKSDLEIVKKEITKLKENGEYKEKLWK